MTIVVVFSSTPEGEAAVAEALVHGRMREASVAVVPLDEAARERANQLVEEWSSTSPPHSVEVLAALTGHDAVDELLSVVAEREAQLIVIGLRRRSTVGKLILGSNAQRILLDAPVPVLTVKADAR